MSLIVSLSSEGALDYVTSSPDPLFSPNDYLLPWLSTPAAVPASVLEEPPDDAEASTCVASLPRMSSRFCIFSFYLFRIFLSFSAFLEYLGLLRYWRTLALVADKAILTRIMRQRSRKYTGSSPCSQLTSATSGMFTSISNEFRLLMAYIIFGFPKNAAMIASPGAANGTPKTKNTNAHPKRPKLMVGTKMCNV